MVGLLHQVEDGSQQELTELQTDCTTAADFGVAPQAHLILRGPNRSDLAEVQRDRPCIIGRDAESDIALQDGRVSRNHAKIYWSGDELVVRDLKSSNGTSVNGTKLTEAEPERTLKAGDRIRIGSHELVVALVAEGTPPEKTADSADDPVEASIASLGAVVADEKMTRTYGFAHRIAPSSATALILGETGTGKEVLAQQIHAWSKRANKPMVRVNCAALPESLVESELFGHEKGAFTGADRRKIGLAEAAHTGTLFLDEVGEIPLPVQAKLLTMLENRSILRVGSVKEIPIDIRVIAATHRDLAKEVAEGRFREDLYYRIRVVVLRVPPLRQRAAEIPLLAELFARKFAEAGHASPQPVHFSKEALSVLANHSWPGNIRELRNAVEHAMLVSEDGHVQVEHLPETFGAAPAPPVVVDDGANMKAQVAELEKRSIVETLRKKNGNRTHAALELGISLRSLLYKIKKYEIAD